MGGGTVGWGRSGCTRKGKMGSLKWVEVMGFYDVWLLGALFLKGYVFLRDWGEGGRVTL